MTIFGCSPFSAQPLASHLQCRMRSPLGGYDQRYQLRPLPGDQCLGKRSMARLKELGDQSDVGWEDKTSRKKGVW